MNIKMEAGTHKDLDELEQLYDTINDSLEENVNYPGWKKGFYPIREDAALGIDEGTLFVARADNKIIGSVIVNHKFEEGYYNAGWQYQGDQSNILVIHTLAVHPDYLKQGIGRQLVEFAEDWGKKTSIKAIRLDAFEGNLPAIQLYERCGYQFVGAVDLGRRNIGLNWFHLYEKQL